MALPGHRRTKSDKRRRASHFALTAPTLTKDKKTGAVHRPHRVAPGATETYKGIKIHVKGGQRKLEKMLAKTKSKTVEEAQAKPKAETTEKKTAKTEAKATKKKTETKKKATAQKKAKKESK